MNKSIWLALLLAAGLVIVSVRLAYVQNSENLGKEPDGDRLGAETIDNIMTRASVRKYTDEAPTDSMVQMLLRAGMAAHSVGNKQPWRMVVLIDDDVKDSIAASFHNMKAAGDAPLAIVVCGVPGDTFDNGGDAYWVADCSAMAQNINIAAHAIGLGAATCAIYPRAERVEKIKNLLELPDTVVPYAIIPVGYPKAANTAKDKWDESRVSYL